VLLAGWVGPGAGTCIWQGPLMQLRRPSPAPGRAGQKVVSMGDTTGTSRKSHGISSEPPPTPTPTPELQSVVSIW
jgi:hypothetical protein